MNYTIFLTAAPADPGLALGAGTGTEAGTAADAPTPAAEPAGGFFGGMNTLTLVVMYVAIISMAWFLLVRPQRKQQKQMREMQEAIKSGDNVITSSGLYGTVVEVNDETFMLEFGSGKSFRVPIAKNHVVGVRDPK